MEQIWRNGYPVLQVPDVNLIRLYEFDTLDDVIAAAHGLNGYFTGTNTLYKDPADELYKLVLHQSSLSPEDFNRVSSSSGSSTLVMIRMMLSVLTGMASIINGILSASKPNCICACCTLTREDLENHQIRISELAYGTEKAKKLFRDMMQRIWLSLIFSIFMLSHPILNNIELSGSFKLPVKIH